jgi:uncharacterized protein YbjT (DUF2867 family)
MATVLVLGSTGRFRGIVPALLAQGHAVRAATRDSQGSVANELGDLGADVVAADLDDVASLRAAADSADAVFGAGTAHVAGPQGDVRHGVNLAEAAREAGVGHVVYVSVAGAGEPSDVPVFESKRAVEARIREFELPATIVAPVYLMENLWNPWNLPVLEAGRLPSPVPSGQALQQVALADVVAFSVLALGRREELLGERLPIASDELTAREAAAEIAQLLDAPIEVEEPVSPPPNPLFRWLAEVGDHVGVDEVRARFPEIGWHRFGDWAATQDLGRLRAAAARARG